MTIHTITVTEFKAQCLDVIRQVESAGTTVDLMRHGKIVARLIPTIASPQETPTWLRLRGRGLLTVSPETSVLDESNFEAARER